ncbi:hypothetical protein DAEQUDRAFT_270590 [Daedalea quercina L-15889]|uniref:C2H2-type domain-containing protein n=1 Tax=Daedalea quercina L-15889 TaxID=1314783 RepID=A0A165QC25_9APHY|nr:hypothetical protein DAEQUDRAFT_270590 [Daedalea quercina L-15889]
MLSHNLAVAGNVCDQAITSSLLGDQTYTDVVIDQSLAGPYMVFEEPDTHERTSSQLQQSPSSNLLPAVNTCAYFSHESGPESSSSADIPHWQSPAYTCLWRGCGMPLSNDVGSSRRLAFISEHLTQVHGEGLEATRIICQWRGSEKDSICGKILSRMFVVKHIATVHLRCYVTRCPDCGSFFSGKGALGRHLKGACRGRALAALNP